MITAPYPNIIAAIVAYLQQAMGGSLGVTAANQGVWAYYARATVDGVPYLVVQHGPEMYDDSQAGGADSADSTGAGELVQATGDVLVIVIAPTAELAELLAHEVVLKCRDSVAGDLPCADGQVEYMRPSGAASEQITDIGPAIPGVFRRQVTIRYKQEFYAPIGIPTTGAV
jgi:hypothetical protein